MDIFVSVPAYEAMGIAVAEAMAAALPCIVSRVGGLTELICPSIRNSCGKVVPSGQPQALSRAIQSLNNQPLARRLLGQKARRRALKIFQPESHREASLQAYLGAAVA